MEKIEELVKLIFKKNAKNDPSFEYSYVNFDILRICVAEIEFKKTNPKEWKSLKDIQTFYDAEKSISDLLDSGYIGFTIRTGGRSGGDCWGSQSSEERDNDIDTYNNYLDNILEIIAPELTYLTYRKIDKNIIKKSQYTKHEYYGNSDVYHVELIPIKELVETLNDKKVLISQDSVGKLLTKYQDNNNKKTLKI